MLRHCPVFCPWLFSVLDLPNDWFKTERILCTAALAASARVVFCWRVEMDQFSRASIVSCVSTSVDKRLYSQKIGRELAHQIRISEASGHITEICTSSGNTTKDQSEINQEFKPLLF